MPCTPTCPTLQLTLQSDLPYTLAYPIPRPTLYSGLPYTPTYPILGLALHSDLPSTATYPTVSPPPWRLVPPSLAVELPYRYPVVALHVWPYRYRCAKLPYSAYPIARNNSGQRDAGHPDTHLPYTSPARGEEAEGRRTHAPDQVHATYPTKPRRRGKRRMPPTPTTTTPFPLHPTRFRR